MAARKIRVLVVDDSALVRQLRMRNGADRAPVRHANAAVARDTLARQRPGEPAVHAGGCPCRAAAGALTGPTVPRANQQGDLGVMLS